MLFVTAMRDFPMLSQTPPRGRYYTLKSHKGIFFDPPLHVVFLWAERTY